jgi:hypothetical protein
LKHLGSRENEHLEKDLVYVDVDGWIQELQKGKIMERYG